MNNTKATPLVEQIAQNQLSELGKELETEGPPFDKWERSVVLKHFQAAIEKATEEWAKTNRMLLRKLIEAKAALATEREKEQELSCGWLRQAANDAAEIVRLECIIESFEATNIGCPSKWPKGFSPKWKDGIYRWVKDKSASGAESGEKELRLYGHSMNCQKVKPDGHGDCYLGSEDCTCAASGTPTACSPGRVAGSERPFPLTTSWHEARATSEPPKEEHGEPQRPRIHNLKMLDAIRNIVIEHSRNEDLANDVYSYLRAGVTQIGTAGGTIIAEAAAPQPRKATPRGERSDPKEWTPHYAQSICENGFADDLTPEQATVIADAHNEALRKCKSS